jgi:hypothetical protein
LSTENGAAPKGVMVLTMIRHLLAANAHAATSVEVGLTANPLVEVALEANPQVKSARAHWLSAVHSIKQNYAPADPIFGYAKVD